MHICLKPQNANGAGTCASTKRSSTTQRAAHPYQNARILLSAHAPTGQNSPTPRKLTIYYHE